MGADTVTVLAAAWAAALLTRLPPGLLEAGACRVFASAGLRATAGFLGGIAVLDAALTASLLSSGWVGAGHKLPPVVAVTAGAGVCVVAARRLWQAKRSGEVISVSGGIPVLLGMRAAIESPGWWNWWLLIGSATMATWSATPLAVGTGLMTGVLSWVAVVLLTIRAGRRFIAQAGERRWQLATAWLLLGGGVLLVARSLL